MFETRKYFTFLKRAGTLGTVWMVVFGPVFPKQTLFPGPVSVSHSRLNEEVSEHDTTSNANTLQQRERVLQVYKWFWKGVVRDIIRIKRLFLHLWQGREFLILPFPSVERHVNYFNKNLNENLISSLGQSETPRADLKMTFLLSILWRSWRRIWW